MADGGGRAAPAEELAPVIPLFGDREGVAPPAGGANGPAWHASWLDEPDGFVHDEEDDAFEAAFDQGRDDCAAIEREIAETTLLRKLRTRQLSVSEARVVLRERDLAPETIEAVLDAFQRRGYLDDTALASQLIASGAERKGQGRTVLAQTLAKRGIPREVADAALHALPDDDDDRALAYARSKAASLARVGGDASLRRLVGQLTRRGYPGPVAMTAARQALAEATADG